MTDANQCPDDWGPSQADSSTAEVRNKQPGLHTRFNMGVSGHPDGAPKRSASHNNSLEFQ